ncbi:signal transduction histidine kinase/ActR/RegA family two-component response regulator [Sphingomonas sp. F9_3S_D5_B_2]
MTPDVSERALILAPQGRDAIVASAMLAEAGVPTAPVADVAELAEQLFEGAGFAVLTEESLAGTDLRALSDWLDGQAEWSDFPFIVLTQRGGGLERNPQAARLLNVLGNVTFLERPFHPTTFVSLAQSAQRTRRRQYQARARLEELNLLAADLERRVEQRTAEHAAAVAQLHEAQKLETLGQLTGGVAHDFNNLLTPITGALDLLQRKYGDSDPRSARLLTNALQAADRAKTLLQRLLGFARRQALRTEAVDIGALLTGMRELIDSSVGPAVEVKLRCAQHLQPAMIDPNQLELAILNLTVNARDAMPKGGPLTILAEEVAMGPGSEPRLKPGLYIRLSVIDAGTGMSPEVAARAIEPFYSTKEFGHGTGLGLSMVHGLAAQLGGGFALTSEPGEGTRVDVYLPVAEDGIRTEPRRIAEPVRSVGRRLAVLLVDDEEIVRTATAEMIRDLGHDVEEAGSGPEALKRLDEGLNVDILVTDYMMPGMDGGALARQVKEIHPELTVLLITGYTGRTDEVHHLPRLAKPFGRNEVATALASLMDESKVVPFPGRSKARKP